MISSQLIASQVPAKMPPGYISGLRPLWLSNTTFQVTAGICRGKDNLEDIPVTVAVTVDKTTDGITGMNTKVLSGTGQRTSSPHITGVGTTFSTDFGSKAGTGTLSTASTTVTGTGTRFLSELAVGDMLGNATRGWSRVTDILSDTSAVIQPQLPNGNASAEAYTILENPTIEIEGFIRKVEVIHNDTTLDVVGGTLGSGSAGQVLKVGSVGTNDIPDQWLAVWAIKGASGASCMLSTQWTTPYTLPVGYDQDARLIGWMRNDASGNLRRMFYRSDGQQRTATQHENNADVLTNGTQATFFLVDLKEWLPPTAIRATMAFSLDALSGPFAATAQVRQRNGAHPGGIPAQVYNANVNVNVSSCGECTVDCDGAQGIEYLVSAGGPRFSLRAPSGFVDSL